MTVLARHVVSIPARSATDTWAVITTILRAEGQASADLEKIRGIACSLIARQAFRDAPVVVHGHGDRVRIYCLYDEAAVSGEDANEQVLGFNAASGDWQMSLPCPAEDLDWVQTELNQISTRVTARDASTKHKIAEADQQDSEISIDAEAFLNK